MVIRIRPFARNPYLARLKDFYRDWLESQGGDDLPPENTGLPYFFNNRPTVGEIISEATMFLGAWKGYPVLSAKLRTNGTILELPYQVQATDVGKRFVIVAYAQNPNGITTIESAPSELVVVPATAPFNIIPPFIDISFIPAGTIITDAMLNRGTWGGNPPPTLLAELYLDGVLKTVPYTTLVGDIGDTFVLKVIAANSLTNVTVDSEPTVPVVAALAAPVNTVLPTMVDTTPTVGDIITIDGITYGTWTGNPTPDLVAELYKDPTGIDPPALVAFPYTIVVGDVDAVFTVKVIATNSSGSANATSAGTSPVVDVNIAPYNTALPAWIDVEKMVGDVIEDASITQGTWAGNPAPTLSNQFYKDGIAISVPYTITNNDIGLTFHVDVTATNVVDSATASSGSTNAVAQAPSPPANTGLPFFINNNPVVGQVINNSSVNQGSWTGFPIPTLANVFKKEGVSFAVPYTIVAADIGARFTVEVTATNTSGSLMASSFPTNQVQQAPSAPINTSAPFFLNTSPQVGTVINDASINKGTWSGFPAPSLSTQLRRGTTNLAMPYTVVSSDVGSTFNAIVTATNASGTNTAQTVATNPVPQPLTAPANTSPPFFIDTTPTIGDVITTNSVNNGTWTGNPTPQITKQFKRNGVNITVPYTVTTADVGFSFTCAVTGSNSVSSTTVNTAATSTVPAQGETILKSWTHNFSTTPASTWSNSGSGLTDEIASQNFTIAGGAITEDVVIYQSAPRAPRFTTPANTTGTVPKASINRRGWDGTRGKILDNTWWIHIISPNPPNNLLVWDWEIIGDELNEPLIAGNWFGSRLGFTSNGSWKDDMEYFATGDPARIKLDDTGRVRPFPIGVMTKVRVRRYLHETAGYTIIWNNDVEVASMTNYRTLPTTAQINQAFGINTSGTVRYSRLEFGNTANGSSSVGSVTVQDSVFCKEVTEAPPASTSPTNSVAPSWINNTHAVGSVIDTSDFSRGTWAGTPTPSFTDQLKRNNVNVAMPYTVVAGDVGATFTVSVTGTNTAGTLTVSTPTSAPVPSTSGSTVAVFEQLAQESTLQGMIGAWPFKWQAIQFAGTSGPCTRETSNPPPGHVSFIRMTAGVWDGQTRSKTCMQRSISQYVTTVGDRWFIGFWMKVYSSQLGELFVFDPEGGGGSVGARTKFNSANNWRLDRGEIGRPSLNDVLNRNSPFPIGTWVFVEKEMGIANTEGDPRGYLIIKNNGVEVFRRESIQTMGTAYDQFQFGVTANSSAVSQTMDMGSVRIDFRRG